MADDDPESGSDYNMGKKLTFGGESVKTYSTDSGTNNGGGGSGNQLQVVQVSTRRLSSAKAGFMGGAGGGAQRRQSVATPTAPRPEWYSDLTEEHINMFKQVFELLDRDGDHTLDTDELFELLGNLDVCLSKEEIRSVLTELDSDGNGVIDFMEFLYAMAMSDQYLDMLASDDPDVSDRQKPNGSKYSKRQSLFFTAITKFAMKNSLSDVERYYNAKARHAPHVIAHYTAGARVIGLTDRQMERHYADLAKASENLKSPYAKPLHFVTMVDRKKAKTKNDQIRVKIGQQPHKAPPCRGRRSAIAHDDDELSQLRDQLEKLADEGSVIAKIPDVHLLKPLRNKIASGELARELEQTKHRKLHAHDHHHDHDHHDNHGNHGYHGHHGHHGYNAHHHGYPDHRTNHHYHAGGRGPHRHSTVPPPRQQRHVKKQPTKRKQPSWRVPSMAMNRVNIPLPSLIRQEVGGHESPTVDDLPTIRRQVARTLNMYYDKLRWRTVHNAWEHWGELHVDQFPSDYLKDNFRRVYQAYSPHTKEEAFVIAPWMPPPSPGKYGCYGGVGRYSGLGRYSSARHERNTENLTPRPGTSMF